MKALKSSVNRRLIPQKNYPTSYNSDLVQISLLPRNVALSDFRDSQQILSLLFTNKIKRFNLSFLQCIKDADSDRKCVIVILGLRNIWS